MISIHGKSWFSKSNRSIFLLYSWSWRIIEEWQHATWLEFSSKDTTCTGKIGCGVGSKCRATSLSLGSLSSNPLMEFVILVITVRVSYYLLIIVNLFLNPLSFCIKWFVFNCYFTYKFKSFYLLLVMKSSLFDCFIHF